MSNTRARIHAAVAPRVVVGFLLLCGGFTAAAQAEEAPAAAPWTLDANNWQMGQGKLPDPVLERVKKGEYSFEIHPVDPEKFKHNYSDAFWSASESNEGKYGVDDETCGLKDLATGKNPDYWFGFPFPKIDPKDPQAACKMAQNFASAGYMGGGGGATFTLNGIDGSGEFKRIKLWAHAKAFVGMHGGAIDNPDNLRGSSLTYVMEPTDIDGVAGLGHRKNDWDGQDQAWFYVPATRRVRRVSSSSRSDPVAGLDIYSDDSNCYGGKVEYYKWKLVGEGEVFAPLLDPNPLEQKQIGPSRWEIGIPYFQAAYETPGAKGAPWLVVRNLKFVLRPVWILEGQSEDPYYNFGKVIMYMDKDMYRIYWKLVHNRGGEYFYNAMCAYHFARRPDGSHTAVVPNLVVGVNDKRNRAALGGRYVSQFFEHDFEDNYFTLATLRELSD